MESRLELKVEPKQRLILSPIHDEVLVEVQTPNNLKAGHGWGIITQLRLDRESMAALHSYLAEMIDAKAQ